MPIIRRSSRSRATVTSTRQPSTIQEMGDTTFGALTSADDGQFVSYNATKKKFELVSADTVIRRSVVDNDLPDTFISQVETEIDLGEITTGNLDGGSF